MNKNAREQRTAALLAKLPLSVLVQEARALDTFVRSGVPPHASSYLAQHITYGSSAGAALELLVWFGDEIVRRIPAIGQAVDDACDRTVEDEDATGKPVPFDYWHELLTRAEQALTAKRARHHQQEKQ